MCTHTPDTSWQKRLLSGKTFLLSHLQGKGKKKEVHSFSLWLKKNISAGQGLLVTIHFKILPNCLSTFISLVIQLRVGKVVWPTEWPIHHTYWPLCPGTTKPWLLAPFVCLLLGPSASQIWPHAVVKEGEEWDYNVSLPLKWACMPLLGLFPGQTVSCTRNRLATAAELRREHTKPKELVGTSWSIWQKTTSLWEGWFILCLLEQQNPLLLLTSFSPLFFQVVLSHMDETKHTYIPRRWILAELWVCGTKEQKMPCLSYTGKKPAEVFQILLLLVFQHKIQ